MTAAIPVMTFAPAPPESTLAVKHLFTVPTDGALIASVELSVGVRSVPYLADHGFQGMIVLPGSFYIEMALSIECELSKRLPTTIRNVVFHNPIILSDAHTVIKVEVAHRDDRRVEYAFYEAGVDNIGGSPPARRYAATLEIERDASTSSAVDRHRLSIEDFQAKSPLRIDAQQFYKILHENGNQYGRRFRNVSSIWRMGDEVLGKVAVPPDDGETRSHYLHPSLLDSITQLLAPFIWHAGRTFILRAIDKIELTSVDFHDTLWGRATLNSAASVESAGLIGDVAVFDRGGNRRLTLSGVALTLLNGVEIADKNAATNLVVASTFTAEPLGDSLKFWAHHFDAQLNIEYAPYNQIFQQLLDVGSAFAGNRDGVNVILVGLEDWAVGDQHAQMKLSQEKAEECFGARTRYVLPNGLQIVHLNQYETDYLYNEIFEDQFYFRNGITLRDDDTVIDIGANIGLFSLYVMSRCKNPTIYAFEPAPVVYDLLKANCAAYGANVRTFNIGVSDKNKNATFTFYEKSSVFSGFHSDEIQDRDAIKAVVRNMLHTAAVASDQVEEYVDELTVDRLRSRAYECQLTSVSDIIRENHLKTINLLKIDAEKSELDILNGIEECDWPKIEQIVIEIHDRTHEAFKRVEEMLVRRGYRCVVEQEKLLEHAGLFNLYATRSRPANEIRFDSDDVGAIGERAVALRRNTQDFCAALQSFMNRATVPLVLCFAPRTPAAEANAELNAALDDAEIAVSAEASKITDVRVVRSTVPLYRYPINDYYDAHTDHSGHIPYTRDAYAAIGTAVFRAICSLNANPFKVIVLDCDNTLWKGVCGEDGALGIEVTTPFRALQEFVIRQMNSGMLLCLCSKNNESDALDVFDRRTDMLLKREHLVSWRINWNSKSENIKSLARELNLGLDTFIFIDDNPVDCAEVRINCPGVLTLQLPQDIDSLPSFLDHIWAFDRGDATDEDQKRTRMYQEDAGRQHYRTESISLKDFVKGLQLRIDVSEATPEEITRVSQLTFRTNQFNFTTIRRPESEITQFVRREDTRCMVVHVTDRFGDYGLVGVLMYETKADRYKVDTFLLSCRVLSRGVEHAVVSWLGQRALFEGKPFVEFTYVPTERNSPALRFIASIGGDYRNDAMTSWAFPAERLAAVEYDPEMNAGVGYDVPAVVKRAAPTPRSPLAFVGGDRSKLLQRIGDELSDIGRLVAAIGEFHRANQPLYTTAEVTPASTLEASLEKIWSDALGRQRIGMNDNFFDLGGTSLKAVQVIAMIKKKLQQTVSIVTLFECPTVRLLAAKLSAVSAEAPGATAAAAARLRGQQRRRSPLQRKVS